MIELSIKLPKLEKDAYERKRKTVEKWLDNPLRIPLGEPFHRHAVEESEPITTKKNCYKRSTANLVVLFLHAHLLGMHTSDDCRAIF